MKKLIKSRLIAVHKDKVLVLKKVARPLRYTLPGGVKKKKETESETLIREVGEEIKLKLTDKQLQFYLSHVKKGKFQTVLKNYYLVQLKQKSIKVKEKHKFEEALWLEWKEALPFMDKMDRTAVRSYFKSLGRNLKKQNSDGYKIPPRIAM
ncbi:NUDIX hydrolase [Flagellimonas sediminis]|uniref:NUDIX domain-containing protein n=1 Tax=Flagellimonas sediminis TaxID=2696468 RepID=A0A6I5KVR7_9FLAO|nr:NUDIX domain-containing protein [Allomuricauda sediminis]NDV43839.1 NUDIX domain-containing protein [Allomuricauda sediminis]